MSKQVPNPGLFVVHMGPKDKEEVCRRLEPIGKIEDLGEENVLLLRPKSSRSKPQAQWQQITEILGSAGTVQPVLSDDSGAPLYPTGELTVRFQTKPSASDLKQFAAKYGLRLRDRNEFVPEQAAFQVMEPADTYLPDLVERIGADKAIKRAWANTLSHYKRMK